MIHPRLLRLLEVGRDPSQHGDLGEVLKDAAGFVSEQHRAFEASVQAIPQDGPVNERVQDIRAIYRSLFEALKGVAEAIAQANANRVPHEINRIDQLLNELVSALAALDEVTHDAPLRSPLPIVNRLIYVALNVRSGHVKPAALGANLTATIEAGRVLHQNFERFRALYNAPPGFVRSWESDFAELTAGLRGVATWLDSLATSSPLGVEALDETIPPLERGSTALSHQLKNMDELARANTRWSKLRVLDELLRAAEGVPTGKVSKETARMCIDALRRLGGMYEKTCTSLAHNPLAFTVRNELTALKTSTDLLNSIALPWFERCHRNLAQALAEVETLAQIRAYFEATVRALGNARDLLRANAEALRGAANIEEIVSTFGQLTFGSVTTAHIQERVTHALETHASLVADIDNQDNPALMEIRAYLVEEADAIEEMALYLDDGNERHLRNGFVRLVALHPRMMEMHAELRVAAEEQRRQRERTISCFHCGATNSAMSRHCTSCNAMLPIPQSDEAVYTDIVGETSEEDGLPANLRKLQTIAERAQNGDPLDVLAGELQQLHDQLNSISQTFDRGVGQRAGRSETPELANYARAFQVNVTEMLEAIRRMIAAAHSGQVQVLVAACDAAVAAGRELQTTQEELLSNLSGR